MTESVDVQIARIEEQMKGVQGTLVTLVSKMDEASASRKVVHQAQEAMGRDILHINHRLDNVEKEVRAIQPTSDEYLRYRERVRGAGILGVALWKVGGIVLLAAGWIYSAYLTIVGRPPP